MSKYFKYIKYAVSLLIIIATVVIQHSFFLFLAELCELIIIVILSDILISKQKVIGRIFNSIFTLILNAQLLVHLFTVEYTTMVMLTNITLIQDLSGKAYIWVPAVLIVVISSVLPIDCFSKIKRANASILSTALASELILTLFVGNTFSPFFSLVLLGNQYIERQAFLNSRDAADNITDLFYRAYIDEYREKPEELPDNPNIVLIFEEGTSQNIIDDDREIMPNVAYWESQSLSFTGYYNHTFATYRGLMSQLFSGYVLQDRDINTLVSLPLIFSDIGYSTTLINTEPYNMQFEAYLETLGFDTVIAEPGDYNGPLNSLSDHEAYDLLFETMEDQASSSQPFFTTIYTYGTHAWLDSPELQFGDGKDPVLNKFHNADYWFGEFMERFNESSLADNTIIIFTTDHCTYGDVDFSQAFPDYTRVSPELDEVPFFIYYQGITPEEIFVDGRNSISLAPTILDYLDISAPNYFLGCSLFANNLNHNNYDRIFSDGDNSSSILTSNNCVIGTLSENQYAITNDNLNNYYIASTQTPLAIEN